MGPMDDPTPPEREFRGGDQVEVIVFERKDKPDVVDLTPARSSRSARKGGSGRDESGTSPARSGRRGHVEVSAFEASPGSFDLSPANSLLFRRLRRFRISALRSSLRSSPCGKPTKSPKP